MTGKVLDSWSLLKPLNWQPDFNVRNLFASYFISNYTTSDFLESTGMSPPQLSAAPITLLPCTSCRLTSSCCPAMSGAGSTHCLWPLRLKT